MKAHHLLAAIAALGLSIFSVSCERAGEEPADREPAQPTQPTPPTQPSQPNP